MWSLSPVIFKPFLLKSVFFIPLLLGHTLGTLLRNLGTLLPTMGTLLQKFGTLLNTLETLHQTSGTLLQALGKLLKTMSVPPTGRGGGLPKKYHYIAQKVF